MRRAREEARRRRMLRRLVPIVAIVVVLLVLVGLFGPWGPLKSVLFGSDDSKTVSSAEQKARREKEQADSEAAKKKKEEAKKPKGPVQKKSDTKPPTVAIVVDDTGNTLEKLPLWLQIDAPLSFAVLPYTGPSAQLATEFHNAGYEVMLHIPTANAPPNSFSGQGQLASGMDRGTVFATLDADLTTVPFVTGINNHQGGAGCDDLQLMTYECEWAKQHGFYVVDSNSSIRPKVADAAVSLGLGHKKNQVFIDHQNDPNYIRGAMRELAGIARKNGTAIGICHYHRPNTAAVVGEMVNTLKAEGIHFAFARDINN